MSYGQLRIDATIDTRKVEQGVDLIDNMCRTLARSTYTLKATLDTKAVSQQLSALTKGLGKSLVLNVDVNVRMNGLSVVEGQSKKAADATKQLESAASQASKTLNNALKGIAGTAKAEKDLQRTSYALKDASRFAGEFDQHLKRMQGVLDTTGAKGEAAGAKLRASLEAVSKSAGGATGAFAMMGRGLSAVGTIGGKVASSIVGVARSIKSMAVGFFILPALYRSFGQLREMTLGYSITVERARTSLTSMFGGSRKAAEGFLDQLEKFAIRTQFNFDDLASMAPQLRVAKIETQNLIPTFTALGDAVTSASKGKEGLKALVGDLVSLSARGKVTGADIRNFASSGGVNIVTYLARAYSDILPKGTKQAELALRSMISKGLIPADKAIKAIVAGIENDPLRAGQMEKQSKNFEASLSNIGDALKRVLGKQAFGPTFDWLTGRVNSFLKLVSSSQMEDFGKAMGPRVLSIVQALSDASGAMVRFGVRAYNVGVDVVGVLGRVGEAVVAVVNIGKTFLPILEAAAAGVALSFVRVGTLATWAFVKTLPSAMVSAVASLRSFVVLARTAQVSWAYVPAVVLAGVVAVTKGFSFLVDKTYDMFEKLPGAAGKFFKDDRANWESYKKDYSQGFDELKGIAVNGLEQIAGNFLPDMSKYKIDLSDIEKLLKNAGVAAAGVKPPPVPKLGWDDTNQNSKEADKARKKSLQELAKGYDALSKASEDSAKRQLDALKHVNDSVQGLFGSIQKELARYGVFNSPLDIFIARIQKLLDIPNSASNVVNTALARLGTFTEAARKAREEAAKINTSGVGATGGTGAATGGTAARVLTTFKTREEMMWSNAFKSLAQQSAKVQNLVATQFKGNWEKMFAVMGNTSLATRKKLADLAKPSTSQSFERLAYPEQWNLERMSALIKRFELQARIELGPRERQATISPTYANGSNPSLLSTQAYQELVGQKARDLTNAYLRKIGELQTYISTTSGYPKGFDFGTIKRTQTRFTQTVPVAGAGVGGPTTGPNGETILGNFLPGAAKAGIAAGNQTIEGFVEAFNKTSPKKLKASCADVASRVMAAIGQSIQYSANAGVLEKNVINAGWKPVPLGTRGSLNFQGYPGNGYYGKVSGEHVTVGLGNGRVMGSSNYKVSTQSVGSLSAHDGRPRAYLPNGVVITGLKVPKFLTNPMGVGDAAALETGDNGVGAFKANVAEMLKGLRVDKLSLPTEWGKPIAEAADNAYRFAGQMLLADTSMQDLFKAKLGDKYGEFVRQLREATNAADGFITRLKAGKVIADELRALDTKSRTRGREGDPFFALEERRRAGGDLFGIPDLSAVQTKAMAARAKVLEVIAKVNTLPKGMQGPVMSQARVEEMGTVAADLRRTVEQVSGLHTLQTKVLRDALDSQTYAIKENARAQADRQKVLQAGAGFLTQSTFDEYAYGRAVELRGKEVEYWASVEVKASARRVTALEAFAKANVLPKWGQGPTAAMGAVKNALAQAHAIRLTLNENASWVMKTAASAFDSEKETGRTIDLAKMRQDMDRRLSQLQEQLGLTNNTALSVGKLNVALEKSSLFYGRIYDLQRAGYGENATKLANELATREQIAAMMERAVEAAKEWKKAVEERTKDSSLNTTLRGLYARISGNSPQLSREVFQAQTQSDLTARFNNGDFDIPKNPLTSAVRAMRGIKVPIEFERDPSELTKRLEQAMQGFDDKGLTERISTLNAQWAQMQTDLEAKQLELQRPLSEFAKAQNEFQRLRIGQTAEELNLEGKILDIAKQKDALGLRLWQQQQEQQLQLAGTFDPKRRAALQLKFDHPEWTKEQVDVASILNDGYTKAQAAFDKIRTLQDDVQSSWNSMFTNIRTKGLKSFDDLFDGISNALFKFGADFLASQTSGLLQNLLGGLTGSIGRSIPLSVPISGVGGLSFGDAAKIVGQSSMTNQVMNQAAYATATLSARQSGAAASGSGTVVNNLYFNGDTHWAATKTSEVGQEAMTKGGGVRNSRRTEAKQVNRFIGTGR